jgi:FKBP-type peptidyl-prolyl cis-trans isomerase SlyD
MASESFMSGKFALRPATAVALSACALCIGLAATGRAQQSAAIEEGAQVAFEYTLTLDDGSVVESNVGAEPVEYVHGQDQILPGLQAELDGLEVDEEKSITLEPAQAYGEKNPEAIQEVPSAEVPEEARKVGAALTVTGLEWPVVVREVRPETIVLDLNHPLAGQRLTFDVRILTIG